MAIDIANAQLNEALRYQAVVLENVYDAVIGFDSNVPKRWAEALGGRLTVESRPGKGTAVYIQVPIP